MGQGGGGVGGWGGGVGVGVGMEVGVEVGGWGLTGGNQLPRSGWFGMVWMFGVDFTHYQSHTF